MLIVEDTTVTVKYRTAIRPLFLYLNNVELSHVSFISFLANQYLESGYQEGPDGKLIF